jgi:hypothetical protein
MSFTFESLIVAIVAVLPGFVSAAVRATLKPEDSPSAGEWVARSIVASLFLNTAAFFLYIFVWGGIDLHRPITQLRAQFGGLPGWSAVVYVCLLYGLALLWGTASGLADERFTPRVLAYRLRLTPISPTTSVFIDVLERLVGGKENRGRHGRADQEVAWLRLRRDSKIIQGRMRKSSVRFAVSEPIEVYLEPAYVTEAGTMVPGDDCASDGDKSRGLYLRIRADDVVEILVAQASWEPLVSPPAAPARPWWPRLAHSVLGGSAPRPEPASRPSQPVTRKQIAPPR